MIRKNIYSIEEVYNAIKDLMFTKNKKKTILLDGDEISPQSQRYQLFFTKGMTCVECGLVGKFFAKEKNTNKENKYHLNLYAIDKDGNEILMTKDHIIPKSKGGKNVLDNYQCMCVNCNRKKGNTLPLVI